MEDRPIWGMRLALSLSEGWDHKRVGYVNRLRLRIPLGDDVQTVRVLTINLE